MSETTIAPSNLPALTLRPEWLGAVGQGVTWLLSGLSFAATLYLCVAWPGLTD